jgi:hypothetical protein
MATRPKIPSYTVPVVDQDGRMNLDWYRFFAQLTQVGEVVTTAGAGAGTLPATPEGFATIFVNSEEKRFPYYPVS